MSIWWCWWACIILCPCDQCCTCRGRKDTTLNVCLSCGALVTKTCVLSLQLDNMCVTFTCSLIARMRTPESTSGPPLSYIIFSPWWHAALCKQTIYWLLLLVFSNGISCFHSQFMLFATSGCLGNWGYLTCSPLRLLLPSYHAQWEPELLTKHDPHQPCSLLGFQDFPLL